jgi:hypothetical protein
MSRYLSPVIADYLASHFSPPATYSSRTSTYSVICTAIPPKFAVVIEGIPFYVDPQDLVTDSSGWAKRDRMGAGGTYGDWRNGEEQVQGERKENRMCSLSVQRAGVGESVLGDAWLKNVVAVFDLGENEMRFAARTKY